MRELPDGNILLTQKTKWSDGTTALVFHPLELLERLAAIIPRPQINMLIYHGVLAPNAKWRKRVVGYKRPVVQEENSDLECDDAGEPHPPKPRYYAWADLMRRTFGYDVNACLECGGRMKLIAMIEEPSVIKKILDHLGLPTEPPPAFALRASARFFISKSMIAPEPWRRRTNRSTNPPSTAEPRDTIRDGRR